ncbi:MAG: hypothetical protein R3D30_03020 [Hyphomicrobiales bacterium]
MKWPQRREILFVTIILLAALAIVIVVKLAQMPPPISTPPAVSALDFWFQRYQTLFSALVALAAGLSAYAVARLNHRREEEKRIRAERNDLLRSFRTCVLDVSRINTGLGIVLHNSAKNFTRALLDDSMREHSAREIEPPSWLSDTSSRLPVKYARTVHQYYHCLRQGRDLLFEFDDSTEAHSTPNRMCREYFLAGSLIQAFLHATLVEFENGGRLEVPVEVAAFVAASRVKQFDSTESEFIEALRYIPIDLSDVRTLVVKAGDFAPQTEGADEANTTD